MCYCGHTYGEHFRAKATARNLSKSNCKACKCKVCVVCVCVCVCCLIVNFSKGRPHNERLCASGTRSFPCGPRKSACGG